MAKYRAIYTKIWSDPDFQEYNPDAKLLFIYLCTNPYVTESGLYPITPKSISNDISIGLETVNKLLNNGSVKNIYYDFKNKYVFVKNFRKYNAGGKPELIKKSIYSDYINSKCTPLWNLFTTEYPDYKDGIEAVQGELIHFEANKQTVDKPLPIGSRKSCSNPICNPICIVTNKSTLSEDNGAKPPQNKRFKDFLNELKESKNKIAVLVSALKEWHDLSREEFESNLHPRMGILLNYAGKDSGYLLQVIWETSTKTINGFHLDYLTSVIKDKKRKDKNKSIESSIVQKPKFSKSPAQKVKDYDSGN